MTLHLTLQLNRTPADDHHQIILTPPEHSHVGEPAQVVPGSKSRWPIPRLSAAWGRDLPAVHPVTDPYAACAKGGVRDQETPERIGSAPFSMYNAIRTAAEVDFSGVPPDLENTSRAVCGRIHTVFKDTVRIQRARGGDWVRAFMKRHPERVHRSVTHQSDKGRDFIAWTAQETMHQVELWVESMRHDMRAFARVGDTHRPRTRTLIIPQDGHRGEGEIIHDVRGFLAARAAGLDTDTVPIPALRLDTPIEPRLRAASLSRRMERASIRDAYGKQQLLHTGLFNHSAVSKDTVLMPNYLPIATHARHAQEQVEAEQADGILSAPFSMPPFFPCRIHPYSAVEQGSKVRFCCDMSAPQGDRDGAGLWSVNASVPFADGDLIAKMKLTSTRDFASDVGILQAGGSMLQQESLPVWVASCDWSRFYRQLVSAHRQLWAQVLWLHPEGPQVDYCTCFGDAAAPSQANRVQVRDRT